MKKILIVILGIILLLILINFPVTTKDSFVEINGKTFYVDVAKTSDQKQKGLSIYKSLPENKGMIFIFSSEGYYPFWMKDMKFPIDIIYIKDDRIVDIFKNVSPPKNQNEELEIVKPQEKANKVLEINANLSDKYNLKKGDLIKINI